MSGPAAAPAGRLKSILGGSAGNLVEWFDWYVYSAFGLYFAPHFFPKGDPTAQLLNTAAALSNCAVRSVLGKKCGAKYRVKAE